MSFDDAIRKLSNHESQLRHAEEQLRIAKTAYERAAKEAENSLPRLTPNLVAKFRKFNEIYQHSGSDALEVENPVWDTIVQLGMLIDPENWKRWDFEDEEEDE